MEISIKNNLLLKDSLITDAIKHLEKCDIKIHLDGQDFKIINNKS